MVGESKNGLIVESLADGKKFPVFAHERVSSLKEISIYTETDDISLRKVLKKIEEIQSGKPVDNPKKASGNELKSLFEQVVPDYDKDAVYVSDIKKVFTWYNLLLEKDMLDFPEEEEENAEEETPEEKDQEPDTEEEKEG
jgi:hypothetical protein